MARVRSHTGTLKNCASRQRCKFTKNRAAVFLNGQSNIHHDITRSGLNHKNLCQPSGVVGTWHTPLVVVVAVVVQTCSRGAHLSVQEYTAERRDWDKEKMCASSNTTTLSVSLLTFVAVKETSHSTESTRTDEREQV